MSTSYLLDTSVLIPILRENPGILKRLSGTTLYVPSIALGELYYGAEHSVNAEKSLSQVEKVTKGMTILGADKATAAIYGHFKHEQSRKGLLIPDNDLWIAATAFQYSFTLLTRDHHFTWIDELVLEMW